MITHYQCFLCHRHYLIRPSIHQSMCEECIENTRAQASAIDQRRTRVAAGDRGVPNVTAAEHQRILDIREEKRRAITD